LKKNLRDFRGNGNKEC